MYVEQKRSRFYVYCKGDCNSIQPGKLRVRCGECKDQAFELYKVMFSRWFSFFRFKIGYPFFMTYKFEF